MPHATTRDKVKLYYEEAGSGSPILFVHEFAADYRSWEPQMRYFSRRHRCITYSARGYAPSDVPKDAAVYTYEHFRDDAIAILDHLKIDKAHIVGLSMGGYSALCEGLRYPQRALSLTLAGTGSGSETGGTEEFRTGARAIAEQFEKAGSAEVAKSYGNGPTRVPFEVKDQRGHGEFLQALGEHIAQGSANTMRTFQGERPPVQEFEAELKRLAVPTLIVVGDEDEPCIEPSISL
jgi:proline iminopeptidase